MGVYEILAFSLMVACSQAFLLSRGNPVADHEGRPVNQSCLALADEGSCQFYSCFEQRLPCGRDWYILRHGQYYCNKMQTERPNFSEQGQNFLSDAQRCMTQALKPLYQRDYVDCHVLEHQAVASITPCFIDNAFCSTFREEPDNFFQIYEFSDLFTRGAGKVWREITELTVRCGTEYLRDFSSEARNEMQDAFNGLRDSFEGLRDD